MSAREWKSYDITSIFYMIQYGDFSSNLDMYEILALLDEYDVKYCMDAPSKLYMRKYYALKSQSHDPDTTIYMEALSG